jgi:hypothetical protein
VCEKGAELNGKYWKLQEKRSETVVLDSKFVIIVCSQNVKSVTHGILKSIIMITGYSI